VPVAEPGELDVVVVCNGCRDRTAQIAAGFGPSVRVIETDVASKTHALNLGDGAARSFPRIYIDADVVLSLQSVRALAAALRRPGALAAAPRAKIVHGEDSDWSVRAFYRFWMALPFMQEGMITGGAYALSEEGRRRFDAFPDLLADDGFVRLHFAPEERIEVGEAVSEVRAPAKLDDLIKIRSRSRLGVYQLRARFPEKYRAERQTKRYRRAIAQVATNPALYLAAIPFILVSAVSRVRAARQLQSLEGYVWERDDSSRS
jgi:hypothetical protein